MDVHLIHGLSALSELRAKDPAIPEYPSTHLAGMKVPIGGSSCASCEYLSEDQKHCKNSYFIRWAGPNKPADSDVIPGEIDAYCSDYYEPNKEAKKGMGGHNGR